MFKTTATILRGRGSSWVFLIGTFNKVSRLFSDRLQCGPKKSMPGSTHLQNSGYWGRRQVAKNGRIEVVRCLVEICPPLVLVTLSSKSLVVKPLASLVDLTVDTSTRIST